MADHSDLENLFDPGSLGYSQEDFRLSIAHHLAHSLGKDIYTTTRRDWFKSTSYALRERLMNSWHHTQRAYYRNDVKRVYYFSMEFLMGRSLSNNMLNMGVKDACAKALYELGQKLETIQSVEVDVGLGNGGLGRLAACFLDSMATHDIPGYGYGLRYEFGAFSQDIVNGEQVENADHWLQFGNVWEVERPESMYMVRFGGVVKDFVDDKGEWRHVWLHDHGVMAGAYDTPIPGYRNHTVNTLRLWSAKAIEQFDFSCFNEGAYVQAVEDQIKMENISRVLYPDDTTYEGKVLRFKQQYFFVSASLQDIIRRYKKERQDFSDFSRKVVIQLNDTHPSLSVLELMRLLLDIECLAWEESWTIVTKTFAYTNHTVLLEALEKWPVQLFEEFLPRHLQILYEINHRFLADVEQTFSQDPEVLQRMSLIEEGDEKMVRMSHLAIVGSHHVNGVAVLHTDIIKHHVFEDFYHYTPHKFLNVTNGVSIRRWLLGANPELSALITEGIGFDWTNDIEQLSQLESLAKDATFQEKWCEVKLHQKRLLRDYIKDHLQMDVMSESLFDAQVKRIHEYKRQLLKVMHVIHLYASIKEHERASIQNRTVIFSGKAAPGYQMAKAIIHLINAVAAVVNNDPEMEGLLKVAFIPNYGVSLAERIIPASDVSEQISTAGMEASGTGNMKFSLNGALTVGTLDGANVEIQDHVGADNIFIFGLTLPQVQHIRKNSYDPRVVYEEDLALKRVIDWIAGDVFSQSTPGVFQPIVDELLQRDYFLNILDFKDYVVCQNYVETVFGDVKKWTEKSILNVAQMAYFSSDRAILEYAQQIWHVK